MLTLITGPRGSGKSAAAEQMIKGRGGAPLYVATLPLFPWALNRIRAHCARRDGRWTVYEALKPWKSTENELQRLFSIHNLILLDGISSLLWCQIVCHGASPLHVSQISGRLLQLMTESPANLQLVLVDCSVPFPNNEPDCWFNREVCKLHGELSRKAEANYVLGAAPMNVDWRITHA